MSVAEWFDRRRRLRMMAQDEAVYMLRDHGEAAELAIEHELSLVPQPCSRRTMLKMAKTKVGRLRIQRRMRAK